MSDDKNEYTINLTLDSKPLSDLLGVMETAHDEMRKTIRKLEKRVIKLENNTNGK